jgi:hypothetical protein
MTTVTVGEHDTLPEVLERIRGAGSATVTLAIPDHSPIFLTATEFRTLRDMADKAGVTIQLETEDTLRHQLASMFGLSEYARPSATSDDGQTDSAMDSTPSFHGWRTARKRHTERMAGTKPTEDPIAVSRRRRSELYEPGASKAVASSQTAKESGSLDHVPLSYLDEDPGSARARLIGRIVAVVAVLALILGIAGWYYMPAVTITGTLRQGQIRTELLYSVTRPGGEPSVDAEFSVEGDEVSDTVSFDISIPTTGKQVTPDKSATGSVLLRNASTAAVTIPAGTTLTTAAGISVTTDDDVEVPAGSPDGSTIGEATVNVTAVEPGSGGNLAAGELSGKVGDQPVYFSNRDAAMAGGSDIEVAVVSADDIANLEEQVSSDLRRVIADDWTTQLPEGQVILAPSVEAGKPEYSIEQKEGDAADTVTLTGTVEATALAYDMASVREQALDHYEEALAAEVPEGYELVPGTVELAEPELISEAPDSVEFRMAAAARVRARFDDSARDSLAENLAGSSADEANGILANVPQFESWSVERSPGWWPDRMPQDIDRVTVEISDGTVPEVAPEASPSPEVPDQ